MLAQLAEGKLTIRATDDLKYVLDQIPGQITHYQEKKSADMPVVIDLTVNGKYVQEIPFKLESAACKAVIPGVKNQLASKKSEADLLINSANMVQTFYISARIVAEYRLGDCTNKSVVKDIRNRLRQLTEAGFILKDSLTKEEDDEVDEAA